MQRMFVPILVLVFSIASAAANAQTAASKAAPGTSIPTIAINNVARHGFFYAGGKYVGELGPDKESTMGGAMYVEVLVPKQIRSPYPIVFLHGAGQTGVDWLQTPDGRPGWAYNFLDMGYVVYLEDYPARGRSQYVPGVDGTAERSNLKVYLEEKSERPDEVRCWLQEEPARKLVNWQNIPVLSISASGTYHRVYDACIPKWLNQAGVKTDFVRLETVGISGNSHMMMLEKNSDASIKFIVSWIQKNVQRT